MATPKVKLKWQDTNELEQGHRIYRGDAYFTEDEAPALIAEVGPDVTEYVDESVVDGQEYWYRVSAMFPSYEMKSEAGLYTASTIPGPGPITFIGGDTTAGYLGETTTSELITGDDLASMIGLTAGIGQFSSEPWLKFSLDGKTLFVAKKPYRHSISWDNINAANAIYGGLTVTIGGLTYKVRLLTGAEADPGSEAGGEWNRLMYNVHVDVPATQVGDNWASYTNTDIVVGTGDGRASWVQESTSSYRFFRGYDGISAFGQHTSDQESLIRGWRPVLELVE